MNASNLQGLAVISNASLIEGMGKLLTRGPPSNLMLAITTHRTGLETCWFRMGPPHDANERMTGLGTRSRLAVLSAAVSCPQTRLFLFRCLFIDVVCASCPFDWFFVVAFVAAPSINDLILWSAPRCEGCWLCSRTYLAHRRLVSLTFFSEL